MSGLGGKPTGEDGAEATDLAEAPSPDDADAAEAAPDDPSMPTAVEPEAGFPNLATVPDRPLQPVTSDDRAEVSEALAADRNNANYTDEQLRGGDEVAAAPPRAVKPAVAAAPASPAPRPSTAAPAKKAQAAVAPAARPAARPAAAPDSFSALFAASGAKRLPGAAQ